MVSRGKAQRLHCFPGSISDLELQKMPLVGAVVAPGQLPGGILRDVIALQLTDVYEFTRRLVHGETGALQAFQVPTTTYLTATYLKAADWKYFWWCLWCWCWCRRRRCRCSVVGQ